MAKIFWTRTEKDSIVRTTVFLLRKNARIDLTRAVSMAQEILPESRRRKLYAPDISAIATLIESEFYISATRGKSGRRQPGSMEAAVRAMSEAHAFSPVKAADPEPPPPPPPPEPEPIPEPVAVEPVQDLPEPPQPDPAPPPIPTPAQAAPPLVAAEPVPQEHAVMDALLNAGRLVLSSFAKQLGVAIGDAVGEAMRTALYDMRIGNTGYRGPPAAAIQEPEPKPPAEAAPPKPKVLVVGLFQNLQTRLEGMFPGIKFRYADGDTSADTMRDMVNRCAGAYVMTRFVSHNCIARLKKGTYIPCHGSFTDLSRQLMYRFGAATNA